ncbi:hypothetical protein Poli38472_010821 [Pythium oligandrum]|uniref:Uncharacterized protein n=1 Tax=Pythium oligandrum TaxID=41045 RepID=A0A8K1CEW8_PYTOL|nr:hypothetical protein Poli38472_010821 [Pythium oligandrum]|eukprot:TMW61758.1 hypothetical protein Poli38472_010821 [Pythium oligandrum]
MTLLVAIAARVLAFEAPGEERKSMKRLKKLLNAPSPRSNVRFLSIAVREGEIYQRLRLLLASGNECLSRQRLEFLQALKNHVPMPPTVSKAEWTALDASNGLDIHRVTLSTPVDSLVVLLTFRPEPLFPLNLGSARRAVRFVHGIVALVTANAYISTLGGGHFLCMHLHQAVLMAKLQIAIAEALQDPVLQSKCRVNLAYNAMRGGKFRKAQRIIQEERVVAHELANEELQLICHAAQVYLMKTYRLHKEFLRAMSEATGKDRILFDNYYRQRVIRKSK